VKGSQPLRLALLKAAFEPHGVIWTGPSAQLGEIRKPFARSTSSYAGCGRARNNSWIVCAKEPLMETDSRSTVRLRNLVFYYLRLGTFGFGGPVALCGQMERELVQERKWLSRDEMRDVIAVCQSLPGPLAIQVGIFVSYLRGGFWGACAGGWAFILPNFIIVSALGALYVHFSGLPILTAIFYGVSPAVISLILHSCYRLAKLGMENWVQWALAGACFFVTIALQAEVAALFVASGLAGVLYYGSLFRQRPPSAVAVVGGGAGIGRIAGFPILGKLLLFFLKAGSLTFGSGLVIVPFLEKGLVQNTGWLNERQFLVAVAIGMIGPGPVVITATFVGYLVAGFWGATVSTIGIFLPSFLFVLLVAPILIRHRAQPDVRGFVKGAYAAAIGTILGASVLLGKIAIGDLLAIIIALLCLLVLFRWKVSNPLLIAATAAVGIIAFPLLNPSWVFVK
jgi:chromate transporter